MDFFINTMPKHALITMSGLLIAGTGSSFPLETVSNWQSYLEPRSSLAFDKLTHHDSFIDIRSPKQHLENIRTILNPPISELAILFDVSRQSIYKWLTEENRPEDSKQELIETLSKIADTFKNSGILKPGNLLNMKDFNGISLFDLVKTKQPYEEQVKMLITEAQAMEVSYQRSGLAQSKNRPKDDWMYSMSIPAYLENLEG